ncbi:MAG: adenylate/guanylate cyclase domain-containing protein [Nitrosopumilus sp.]|uniref:adenylate/guanylate cyclase domain-containing protein n=1 Tax=Nitrosopumilus sp. TaxID=2024843 RepID=UPI00247BE3BC|nr:adenylate/guanylate cyclase domain-containing protein [Nitrosopumilus sp.]MCV0392085.1 adenylate/guanylate cyclase domain-containing protein [Nitrosopumilus sp.]
MSFKSGKEKTPNIIDMLLSKNPDKTIDSDTLIKNVQDRINNALEKGYQYTRVIDSSEKFLRKNVFGQINMAVLYVDIVGSTKMSMTLPPDKLSTIISSFSQEMSYMIEKFHGYVLKFVGDAVIGYFVENETDQIPAAYNTVACAESMIKVVKQGINPILIEKMALSEISIKIGIDFGNNTVVRYGADEQKAYVDLLGPAMNVAAKIQNLAKPNQIIVGQDIYNKLDPYMQEFFLDMTDELNYPLKHYSNDQEKNYHVYRYKYQ